MSAAISSGMSAEWARVVAAIIARHGEPETINGAPWRQVGLRYLAVQEGIERNEGRRWYTAGADARELAGTLPREGAEWEAPVIYDQETGERVQVSERRLAGVSAALRVPAAGRMVYLVHRTTGDGTETVFVGTSEGQRAEVFERLEDHRFRTGSDASYFVDAIAFGDLCVVEEITAPEPSDG